MPKPEREERPISLSRTRPAWAVEMLPPNYREKPSEEPGEEVNHQPSEEPAPPQFSEVPLDQLDLLPATPDEAELEQQRTNGGG